MLKNLSLRFQLALVALVGIVGCVILGGAQWISDTHEARLIANERGVGEVAALVDRFALTLLQARRAEKDFLLRRRTADSERHAKEMASAKQEASELSTRLGAAGRTDLVSTLDGIVAQLTTYETTFAQVAADTLRIGLTEEDGLRGSMRRSVHAAEKRVGELGLAPLTISILQMRRAEKDFGERREQRYIDTHAKHRQAFAAALKASELSSADQQSINQLIDAYAQDFAAVAEATLASMNRIQALSETYRSVEPRIEALASEITAMRAGIIESTAAGRTTATRWLIGSFIAIFLALGGVSWALGRMVTKPMSAMVGVMRRIAGGELDVAVPATQYRNEVGQMAGALQVFKDSAIETIRLRAAQEDAKAQGEAERKQAMARLADEFEAAVGNVVESVSASATEMQASAESLSATAERTSRQATTVAAASEQASANVQTVATAGEELSSSISEIGHQVGQSTRIAGQAVEEAGRTNAKVQGLAEAAQRIGDVVKLINDIAGQTNLLALNATIEAARAGEAGKGFAVVASEVKNLANQTAKATDEIAAQIGSIQGATQESVDAIQSIGKTIGEVNEIATAIAAAVEEQGAATAEIARNVQQAARGTEEVSSNIGGLTQVAAATGSAASQVLTAAGGLARQAEILRTQVGTFLAKVRAA